MMKSEFEALALRGHAQIGAEMYRSIERYYVSDNDYHRSHGGIYETKQEFVKRVFGGKVNSPRTIAEKIAREAIRENRFALLGCDVSPEQLKAMDEKILEHYMCMFEYNM